MRTAEQQYITMEMYWQKVERCTDFRVDLHIFFKCVIFDVPGGTDKSLARPGKKQATTTKLEVIQHTSHEAQYTS